MSEGGQSVFFELIRESHSFRTLRGLLFVRLPHEIANVRVLAIFGRLPFAPKAIVLRHWSLRDLVIAHHHVQHSFRPGLFPTPFVLPFPYVIILIC